MTNPILKIFKSIASVIKLTNGLRNGDMRFYWKSTTRTMIATMGTMVVPSLKWVAPGTKSTNLRRLWILLCPRRQCLQRSPSLKWVQPGPRSTNLRRLRMLPMRPRRQCLQRYPLLAPSFSVSIQAVSGATIENSISAQRLPDTWKK